MGIEMLLFHHLLAWYLLSFEQGPGTAR